MINSILLLNASYEPLTVPSLPRAVNLPAIVVEDVTGDACVAKLTLPRVRSTVCPHALVAVA